MLFLDDDVDVVVGIGAIGGAGACINEEIDDAVDVNEDEEGRGGTVEGDCVILSKAKIDDDDEDNVHPSLSLSFILNLSVNLSFSFSVGLSISSIIVFFAPLNSKRLKKGKQKTLFR